MSLGFFYFYDDTFVTIDNISHLFPLEFDILVKRSDFFNLKYDSSCFYERYYIPVLSLFITNSRGATKFSLIGKFFAY
jgi:hypothetical protein